MKKQTGISLIGLICMIAIIGVVGLLGSKIGLGYLDQKELRNAVNIVLNDTKTSDKATIKNVKNDIMKSLSASTVEISSNDIVVSKDDSGFEVEVSYIKEIEISSNMKLVVDYSFTETQ